MLKDISMLRCSKQRLVVCSLYSVSSSVICVVCSLYSVSSSVVCVVSLEV